MQVLIVDDELNICKGIKRLLRKMEYPLDRIVTMTDSVDAVAFASKHKPDIIMSDVNMPGLNGFEMVEKILKVHPNVCLIMISCYNDVHFLKSAFRLNAIDYIFKPVDTNELCLVFEKAMQMCTHDPYESNSLISDLSLVRERKIASVLMGESFMQQSIEICFQREGLTLSAGKCLVVANIAADDGPIDTQLARDTAKEIIKAAKDTGCSLYALALHGEIVLIIQTHQDQYQWISSIRAICQVALDTVKRCTNMCAHAAISEHCQSFGELANAYKNAFHLNCNYDSQRQQILFHHDDSSPGKENIFVFEQKYVDAMIKAIVTATRFSIDIALNDLWDNESLNNATDERAVTQVRLETINVISKLCSTVASMGGFELSDLELDLQRFTLADSIADVKIETARVLQLLFDEYQHTGKRTEKMINMINMMIEESFAHPDFNVQYIATQLNISPNYLSASFKQHTGNGVNQVLTNRRIKEAKQLILDNKLPISDISMRVGFTDQNYFARLFRKHCNMSPTEYREMKNV